MGAKTVLSRLGALCAGVACLGAMTGGCSTAQRLLPPGFMKYEELAGDQPPNPIIEERIAERRRTEGLSFPNLSEQPQKRLKPMPAAEKAAEMARLVEARETVNAAVAQDRAAAAAERAEGVVMPGADGASLPLGEAGEALGRSVAEDDAAARRERDLPPRNNDDNGEQ